MKTFALATAALGLALTSAPAFAGSDMVKTTTISTAGLDLSSPEGQKMLDRRVKSAAREVCGITSVSTGSRLKSLNARSCYQKAIASAKQQVAANITDNQLGG